MWLGQKMLKCKREEKNILVKLVNTRYNFISENVGSPYVVVITGNMVRQSAESRIASYIEQLWQYDMPGGIRQWN